MASEVPLISVVTVVYNRAHALAATIASVAALSYPRVEYIIIDGGSTDGTVEVIKQHSSSVTRWISEQDGGMYDAMNKGAAMASGAWINFMNCGDEFASPHSLAFFERSLPAAEIIYGDALIVYPRFTVAWPIKDISGLWKGPAFCHQACFVSTALAKSMPFDTQYKVSSDFDFLLRAWRAGKKFARVAELICRYDFREGASVQHPLLSMQERRNAVRSVTLGFSKELYFFSRVLYLKVSFAFKKLAGPRITQWITRRLRK